MQKHTIFEKHMCRNIEYLRNICADTQFIIMEKPDTKKTGQFYLKFHHLLCRLFSKIYIAYLEKNYIY